MMGVLIQSGLPVLDMRRAFSGTLTRETNRGGDTRTIFCRMPLDIENAGTETVCAMILFFLWQHLGVVK